MIIYHPTSMLTTLLPHWRHWIRHIHQLLPTYCLLCQDTIKYGQYLCMDCSTTYFPTSHSVCLQCALPLQAHEQAVCMACHLQLPAFDQTIAVTTYAPPADNMVIQLKYHQQLAIAPVIAQRMCQHLIEQHQRTSLPDLLCPVPISRQRLASRGYNQALEIAKPLASMLGLPLYPQLCQRIRHTTSQVHLSEQERHCNQYNAFALHARYASMIQDKHIGLVDDVMTTGKTLHAVATLLKSDGAARVTNFVFARTYPMRTT